MERNKSKWVILSHCLQDDVKHVLTATCCGKQTRADKIEANARRAKLASQFPFGVHPRTFNMVSVYVSISRIDKMSLMHNDRVHVAAMPQLAYVSVGRPPVRHNV